MLLLLLCCCFQDFPVVFVVMVRVWVRIFLFFSAGRAPCDESFVTWPCKRYKSELCLGIITSPFALLFLPSVSSGMHLDEAVLNAW